MHRGIDMALVSVCHPHRFMGIQMEIMSHKTPAYETKAREFLSLIVPVFNEEDSIDIFMARIEPELQKVREDLGPNGRTEVVFVDDGSQDRTVAKISSLIEDKTRIKLVKLSRNFGKDAALAAGLSYASGDAVVPMDVDLQDPPELLLDMVQEWKKGAMIVNAVRTDRSQDGWFKRASANAFYKLFNVLAQHPIPSNVGDFRLMDRQVVHELNQMPERVRFNKGMVAWLGFTPVNIHYSRPPREAGTTKWRTWSLWNFALDGITGSSTLPLRIWSYVGGFCALSAIVYVAFIVIRTLIFGVDTPGYASLMVVTLSFGALNFISLGILGEYVGRISIEVRRRPLYLVESVQGVANSNQAAPDLVMTSNDAAQ